MGKATSKRGCSFYWKYRHCVTIFCTLTGHPRVSTIGMKGLQCPSISTRFVGCTALLHDQTHRSHEIIMKSFAAKYVVLRFTHLNSNSGFVVETLAMSAPLHPWSSSLLQTNIYMTLSKPSLLLCTAIEIIKIAVMPAIKTRNQHWSITSINRPSPIRSLH